MPAVSSGGILREYEFRSLHSTSQSSSPNVVPLNRVRITRSHSSLLLCSRRVRAAFRSSSPSPSSISLALFCAVACDEARAHDRITNSRRIMALLAAANAVNPASMFFALTVSKGIADLTNPDVSMCNPPMVCVLSSAKPFLAPAELHIKTARIKSTNRALRIGGTTRREHRAGERRRCREAVVLRRQPSRARARGTRARSSY
jgi:hypothetical protein